MADYIKFQVPRIGVDCDRVDVTSPSFEAYAEEIQATIDQPHYSPYHTETIREHIDMTIEKAKKTLDTVAMMTIATYHDLGKSITRVSHTDVEHAKPKYVKTIEKYGRHDMFVGHEQVSAVYYLISVGKVSPNDVTTKAILEAIYQHMNAHAGISDKTIRKNKLTDYELGLIETMRQIDAASRQPDLDLLDGIKAVEPRVQLA